MNTGFELNGLALSIMYRICIVISLGFDRLSPRHKLSPSKSYSAHATGSAHVTSSAHQNPTQLTRQAQPT